MRPITIALTLLVLAACENSTDPFLFGQGGGGGAITQGQATGNWSFTVTKQIGTTCPSGALIDGSVLTAHLEVGADGALNTSTSTWRSPSGSVFSLSGAVSLSDGRTDLHLSGGGQTGMELTGTSTAGGAFTGTLSDPDPGLFPVFGGACQYNATGAKT